MSYCRKANWDDKCERMINSQIAVEMQAFHTYNALYALFLSDSVGFPGAAEYFKTAADEELEHARKFIAYQNTRGGKVKIELILQPDLSELDATDDKEEHSLLYRAINLALSLEQKVYSEILFISKNCGDPGLEDFLDDFIQEQLKGQFELGIKLQQLNIIGLDGHGLIEYDKTLA